jgi:hypothetical protein
MLVLYGCDSEYWNPTIKSPSNQPRCNELILPSLCVYSSSITTACGQVPVGIKTVIPFCDLESVSIDPHSSKLQYKFTVTAKMPIAAKAADGAISVRYENENFVFAVETSDMRVQWEKWIETAISISRSSRRS